MNYFERMPVRTESYSLTSEPVELDTMGLEAIIYANGGDVLVKASERTSDDEAFIIKSGSTICLNGCFYISGNQVNARVLYCRII